MPMDKYQRQSQKSNLWARRRNKTANLLLNGQLRYLERRCKQGMKQHSKSKSRLEEELRELVCISEEGDSNTALKSSECKWNTEKIHRATPRSQLSRRSAATAPSKTSTVNNQSCHSSKSQRTSSNISRNKDIEAIIQIELKEELPKDLNILKAIDKVNESFPKDEERELNLPSSNDSCLGSLKGSGHSIEDINDSLKEKEIRSCSQEFSTASLSREHFHNDCTNNECRFTRDRKLPKKSCTHFPCSIPTTYHAVGFRRDDITTWCPQRAEIGIDYAFKMCLDINDKTSENRTLLNTTSTEHNSNTDEEPENNDLNVSRTGRQNKKCELRFEDSQAFDHSDKECAGLIPQWNKQPKSNKFSFRPASGPAFGPKPRDPILERVRQGSTQALSADKQPPRMTVAGRMRGLKSLILEMRQKHEKAKPVDWAVNYGQRLPMRVLLNPVVPLPL